MRVSISVDKMRGRLIVRIGEVIGERVRARREERGWTQAELGRRVGSHLGQGDWSRQVISSTEQGKRAFTAAELVTFAHVLDVGITYLLTPPPGVDVIELAPGIGAGSVVMAKLLTPSRGSDSGAEEQFTKTGLRFFQHLGDLRQMVDQVQADMDAFVNDLQAVHTQRNQQGTAAGEPES
jgi:transcriptional regulator with XRE-family HTH domain